MKAWHGGIFCLAVLLMSNGGQVPALDSGGGVAQTISAEDKGKVGQAELPTVRIVLFTPSDVTVPEGVRPRLTRIAETAENFLFEGMKQWGYPAAVKSLFRREPDGMVEVLVVKGDKPASYDPYATDYYARDVIRQAARQYHVGGSGDVWWIFVYLGEWRLGERRHNYGKWRGIGNSRDGGSAMMSYDATPGEIRPGFGLLKGFNGDYRLKERIHELGHALGLPHAGPDRELRMGNTLMGPSTEIYAKTVFGKADQVYLAESSAAQLWKHPIFSGVPMNDGPLPGVKLVDYHASFTRTNSRVTLVGKLVSDQPAHSVVVIESPLDKRKDDHWFRVHSTRLGADGRFQVTFDHPSRLDGEYRIRFCFDNGIVTGDGRTVGFADPGDIRKGYRFRDGKFEFDP